MSFQKIVLIIATILLILVLVMFGLALHNKKDDITFPPVQAQCPDYWEVKRGKDGVALCENVQKLGRENCQKEMDFSKLPFIGSNGACNKQKWSRTCGLTWDGITNASGLC
jgi:hypothetical protein